MTSIIKIDMKDGKAIAGRAEFAKGHPANPMSYEDEADKFRGGAEFAKWPSAKAESVIQIVRTLEKSTDVSKISAALTSKSRAAMSLFFNDIQSCPSRWRSYF